MCTIIQCASSATYVVISRLSGFSTARSLPAWAYGAHQITSSACVARPCRRLNQGKFTGRLDSGSMNVGYGKAHWDLAVRRCLRPTHNGIWCKWIALDGTCVHTANDGRHGTRCRTRECVGNVLECVALDSNSITVTHSSGTSHQLILSSCQSAFKSPALRQLSLTGSAEPNYVDTHKFTSWKLFHTGRARRCGAIRWRAAPRVVLRLVNITNAAWCVILYIMHA